LHHLGNGNASVDSIPASDEITLVFSGFRRFSEIAIKPGQIFRKMTWGKEDQKMSTFHDSQNQNPKFLYKISFAFDSGRSFDSISLKLGRTVVSIENWSCIVFGSLRPNEGRAGVT